MAVIGEGFTGEDGPGRLGRSYDNRGRDGKEEHGQQDLPRPGVDGHGGKGGADCREAERREDDDEPEAGLDEGQVEHDGEGREHDDLDCEHEQECPQHLAEVEQVPAHRAQQQPFHAAALLLQGEGAVEPEYAREGEGDPQRGRRDGGHDPRVGSSTKLNITMTSREKTRMG